MRRTIYVLLLSQAVAAATASRAAGTVYFESDDAGHLPELAQDVAFVGSVDAILGRIENAFDADLFRFVIDDPGAFSASTTVDDNSAVDPQLFLFDQWGRGVVANDNRFGVPLPLIPQGVLHGETPGTYLLAVSAADCDPEAIFGEIFPDDPSDVVRPAGVSQLAPLIGWSRDFTATGGNYAIALTGVVGTVAPPLGDYNGNGVVDAADYTVWRDTLGSTTDLRANGDDTGASAGVIDGADYAMWKLHFGQTAGIGTGAGSSSKAAVPEPLSSALLVTILSAVARIRSSLPRMTPHRKFEGLP